MDSTVWSIASVTVVCQNTQTFATESPTGEPAVSSPHRAVYTSTSTEIQCNSFRITRGLSKNVANVLQLTEKARCLSLPHVRRRPSCSIKCLKLHINYLIPEYLCSHSIGRRSSKGQSSYLLVNQGGLGRA